MFRSKTSRFRDQMLSKIGNALNDLKHFTAKSTLACIHWILTPEAQILLSFSLWPAIFKIQGCWKSEMHEMTPEWPLALNGQKYLYTLNTHPEAQISLSFALQPEGFKIQGFENRKCTKWPQNDLKHLSVKSTLCTLNTHPEAQISPRFALWPAGFEIQGFQKSEMHRMTPEWSKALNCPKYTVYNEDSPPKAQISLRFALRSLIFHIIEVFGFPIWYNGEIPKIVKNCKLKISKLQNSTFVRTIEKKIQKKFDKIQKLLEGGVAFWSFSYHIESHVNENENKKKS